MWSRLLSPYLLLFILPILWSLASGSRYTQLIIFLILTAMIGLRRSVGGDWRSYALMFNRGRTYPRLIAISINDPGYMLLGRALARLDLDVGALNLVCGSIFCAGLMIYAGDSPLPGLSLLIATPVLIIVVAMGFTRQSVAVGLFMLSLNALAHGVQLVGFGYLLVGMTFHKSLVIMLPIVLFVSNPGISARAAILLGLFAGTGFCVLSRVHSGIRRFVTERNNSAGALFRMLPTAVALILVAVFEQRMTSTLYGQGIVAYLSFIAAVMVVLCIVASTLADRVGFYGIILQMVAIPAAIKSIEEPLGHDLALGAIVTLYGSLFVGWALLSPFSRFWFPYHSYIGNPAALIARNPTPLPAVFDGAEP